MIAKAHIHLSISWTTSEVNRAHCNRQTSFFSLLVLSLPGHATCSPTTAFLSNTLRYLFWGHSAQCQCSESHRLVMRHTATVHWFRQLKGFTRTAIRSLTWGRDAGKIVGDKRELRFLFSLREPFLCSQYIYIYINIKKIPLFLLYPRLNNFSSKL